MRVLIVDDDLMTAEITADCLMMDPAVSVQIAGDGATALRIAAEFLPDAILLDIQLTDMSGLYLAPRLKAICPDRAPRVILFSGSVQETDSDYLPDGVDAWLTKPAHLDALLDCIFRPTGEKRS